jgi:chromosome segregation ATPase
MKNYKLNIRLFSLPKLMIMLMVVSIAIGGTSCKSKKKIAAEKAAIELANQIEQAKASLRDLLRDDNPKTWQEKKDELDRIKAMQLRDPEVEDLINQVEAKLAKERQEMLDAEAKKRAEEEALLKAQAKYDNVNSHFQAIASAPSVEIANSRIQKAISLYAAKDGPVLIIVSKYGDNQKDYDRPTTIEKYLNYLKDIKQYNNEVEALKYDDFGKIIEIELLKK